MEQQIIKDKLLEITNELLIEMQSHRALRAVQITAALERDLGLGSLERAELFYRIEKKFHLKLETDLLSKVKTLDDLIQPIIQAKPASKFVPDKYKIPIEQANVDASQCKTLLEVLELYRQRSPNRVHIYLQDENGSEKELTYQQIYLGAKQVAQGLQSYGIKIGETVAIMLPTSDEFFFAFIGTLLVGAIPVPIYPPFRPDQVEEYTKREAQILQNAEVRVLITFHRAEALSKILKAFIPSLIAVTTVNDIVLKGKNDSLMNVSVDANQPALIQYTSGSTGSPKGVLLTYFNLLSNIRAYGKGLGIKPTDAAVSWLPLYHDMGLIGAWLGSFYFGSPLTIMSPLSFLTQPERWLWTIHYHQATISAGPNFAYELCVRKISKDDIAGLDLRSWRLAFNGAEAIYPRTIEAFAKKFKPYGFREEAMFPVYGLAESAVALAFPPVGRKPKIDRVERDAFNKNRLAKSIIQRDSPSLEFVCCGSALPGHELRVVDEEDNLLAERQVGCLQFRGPSSLLGYYRNPEATQAIYHDGWWDTGDYAYIADGELYIAGRKKDTIIKAGRNLYPPEIEEVAGRVAGVRKGCVVAFGVHDQRRGTEKFIIAAETREASARVRQQIINQISENVTGINGIAPDEVILLAVGAIPKTSSGKLRRSSCKELYQAGKLIKSRVPMFLQITKLFFISLSKTIKQVIKKTLNFTYVIYAGFIGIIMILPTWLITLILPPAIAAKIVRKAARILLTTAGCPIIVDGRQFLPTTPAMYVANHASYIDILALVAVLPAEIAFIGKEELLQVPILRTFIRKLRHITVNRHEYAKSIDEVALINKTLKAGRPIMIFPEGTFTYATGLRPFKLGAFKVAAEQQIPVCPIALRGTRNILRSGSALFKPGKITVTILPCLQAEGNELKEVSKLSHEVRKLIAQHCGELPIDLIAAGLPTESIRY